LDAIEAGFGYLIRRYEDQAMERPTQQRTAKARTRTTAPFREHAPSALDAKKKVQRKYKHLRLDRVTTDEAAPLLTSVEHETRGITKNAEERVAAQEEVQMEPPLSIFQQSDNTLAYSYKQVFEGEEERRHATLTGRERINAAKLRSHQRLRELLEASATMPSFSTFPSDRSLVGTGSESIKTTEQPTPMSLHDQYETMVDRREKESNRLKEIEDLVALSDSLQAFLNDFHG
jgi:hypothetical protein